MNPTLQPTAKMLRALLLVLGWVTFTAHAHKASDSYLTLTTDGSSITGQWDVALRDLDQVISLDRNDDGNITWGKLRILQPEITGYATSHLRFSASGTALQIRVTELLVEEFSDGSYAVLRFALECPPATTALQIDYRAFFDLDAQHRGLMRLESAGKTQTAVF